MSSNVYNRSKFTPQPQSIGLGTEDVPDITLNSGEWFGERALITGEPRAANVIAGTGHVKLLAFDREGFEEQLVRCVLAREGRTGGGRAQGVRGWGDGGPQGVRDRGTLHHHLLPFSLLKLDSTITTPYPRTVHLPLQGPLSDLIDQRLNLRMLEAVPFLARIVEEEGTNALKMFDVRFHFTNLTLRHGHAHTHPPTHPRPPPHPPPHPPTPTLTLTPTPTSTPTSTPTCTDPFHSKVVTWNEGDKIIKQGEVGKEFYIIKQGTTIVTINQAPDSTMTHETLAIAELKQVRW